MKKQDEERFFVAMASMGELFQKQPSDTLLELYWRSLADMGIDDFEMACTTIINTRKITGTFPLVAEIREAAGGPKLLKVIAAWDKLEYAIHRHAPYDSVIFDDPIINHIVRQWGGWTEMGDWPAEETKWKRREFDKLYEAYLSSNLPQTDRPLVGLTEAENRDSFPEFVPRTILITGSPGRFASLPYMPSEEPKLLEILVEGRED